MQKYKIRRLTEHETWYSVLLTGVEKYSLRLGDIKINGVKKVARTIDLPKIFAQDLLVGKKFVVLQDKYHAFADCAYLVNHKLILNKNIPLVNQTACKDYIDYLPGVFDRAKLDRLVFKFALVRECLRQKIPVSLVAWRNLQNILLKDQNSRIY